MPEWVRIRPHVKRDVKTHGTGPESLCSSSFAKCDTKTPDQWIPVLFSIELNPRAGTKRTRASLAAAA